ncbi:MAG: hypothetical protein ACYTHK_13320 [Planctomycetota bacterium]
MRTPTKSAQKRKLGLDKPCSMCGSAIYFNYSGPLEGICGKCTDQLRRRLSPRAGGPGGGRLAGREKSGFGIGSLILAFLCGAAAAVIILLNGLLPIF